LEARTPQAAESQGRAAHAVVDALVALGVDTFFGIPGGPIVPIFDAILAHPRARLVESRQETAAGFAAAGYYRATGRVPCVVVTAGPGATNAVTGIASAHFEQVPMLVISGDVAWAADGSRLLQDSGPEGIDVEHMLRSVTRATVRVAHARSASAQAISALRAATESALPGPALLVIPLNQASAEVLSTRVELTAPPRPTEPEPRVVEEAARALATAERPLLVIGAGMRRHAEALRRLVDAWDIPFVTTPRAKGIISELHPRSLRHGGLAASMWARRYVAKGVDAALVLGTDLDDCSVGPTRYVGEGGTLIHVDLNPAVFNRNLPTKLGVLCDVGEFVSGLKRVVLQNGLLNGRTRTLLSEVKAGSAFDVSSFAEDDAPTIKPHRAIADLQAAAPEGARFVTDIGEHMLFALHYLTATGPDSFMINLGLGSMGSGICSAIGWSLGDVKSPVICIAGDGGMQMVGMEALVAVERRLPIVFAVFNDARYNMVYHGFKQTYGKEFPWQSPWVDFAGWSRSLGMPALRIDHPGEITARTLSVLTRNGPGLLDIRIDREVRMVGAGRVESLQRMSVHAGAER
jgi:acetolactate synthase-1/2/3 large subunit